MKHTIATMLFAAVTVTLAKAQDSMKNNSAQARSVQREAATVTHVSLGENSKLTVLPSERNAIRKFYRDVLGCPQTRESERGDTFRIGSNFYLGVIYDDSALRMSDQMKSIWLELNTETPEELRQKILRFGIKEIEYFDKEHFYFQAPGGQVFRLAGSQENMSKWQH